jgi:rhamnulokinase
MAVFRLQGDKFMSPTYYLAVDLGAESGRVMLGTLAEDRIVLEEIHRFPNRVLTLTGHLHWDLAHLEKEIFSAVEKAAARNLPIAGISTDSWGVDYVLLDAGGKALGPPYCYRDARTADSPARLFKKLPFSEIYHETGIQFMAINTLFHFEAQQRQDPAIFAGADRFLNIADYFNARLSGVEAAEESLASTTQLYNPQTHAWSPKLISTLELSASLFPKIVPGATVLGPIQGELANHAAFAQTQVIATCSHDTGAAVAAVPAGGENWAYLSSGTWSLLGAELTSPIVTDAAREAGFTNEVGLGGTIRFLKNIAGLWVLQECRRAWEAAGQSLTYEELTALARDNGPAEAHISLQDARFLSPGDMPDKITAFCRETAQPLPSSPGQFTRTILESLALTYAQTLRQLESLVGRQFEKLHIVGGGSRSHLLNQLASDATGLEVVAGPVEATAIGNVLIQALALGEVESAGHLRRIVEDSFPTRNFFPGSRLPDEVHARFQKLHLHKS